MTKIMLTVGFMLVFGVFSVNINSTHASASEINSSNIENGTIIESTVLENGVIREIIKISDDPNANDIMPMEAGVWDLIDDDEFSSKSITVNSHGGDFRLVIHQSKYTSGVKYMYKLLEEDPLWDSTLDSFEGPKSVGTFAVVYRGIDSWCDGDNDLAELHLEKLTYPFVDVYVQFWD